MLMRLAAERATGVFLRDQGILYLAEGHVVHAESPSAPGLDVLLTVGGALPARNWQDALTRAGARHEVGRDLVGSGGVTAGELELCHLGALFDAAFFALGTASGPTRFRYGVTHWFGRVRPVPAAVVARETRRRRMLLDSVWPCPDVDTAPVVPRPPAPGQTVTGRQRALLRLADGVRTPKAIAWALGRPTFHTLVEIRRMAAAGLVESPRTQSQDPVFPEPAPALPGPAAPTLPGPTSPVCAEPDIALLRRIRDALEANL
nr:hypothetical protein [Streptomyces alboflavus]